MRYHRFIGAFDLEKKNIEVTDQEVRNQWHSVLRLKTGDSVILCDGNGHEAIGTITDLNKKMTALSITERIEKHPEPARKITLYVSILRRENFEIVVQKATEIGVSHIVPMLTERTVKTGFNRVRLEKILLEASEQSGRTTLPTLSEPQEFSEAISSVPASESILFDGTGEELAGKLTATHLFVGPEGGFSEPEVSKAKEHGIHIASLGGLTLRAETAAIVVSYLGCN